MVSISLSDRLEVATRLGFTEDEATTLALSGGHRALREDDLKVKRQACTNGEASRTPYTWH